MSIWHRGSKQVGKGAGCTEVRVRRNLAQTRENVMKSEVR